jgi:hypothetical protein
MSGTIILKTITIDKIILTKPELEAGLNEVAERCRTQSGPLPDGVNIRKGVYKVNNNIIKDSILIHSLMIWVNDKADLDINYDDELDLLQIKDYVLEVVIKYLYQYNADIDFWLTDDSTRYLPNVSGTAGFSADRSILPLKPVKFTDSFKTSIISKSAIYRYIYECELEILYELCLAANFLDIVSLKSITSNRIADMMMDKTPLEIRQIFGCMVDFTPEEEAQTLEENKWA